MAKLNKKIVFFAETWVETKLIEARLRSRTTTFNPVIYTVVRPPTLEVFFRSGDISIRGDVAVTRQIFI